MRLPLPILERGAYLGVSVIRASSSLWLGNPDPESLEIPPTVLHLSTFGVSKLNLNSFLLKNRLRRNIRFQVHFSGEIDPKGWGGM